MGIGIRNTVPGDLERVMELYRGAALFMAASGNPSQWKGGYPSRELVKADILIGASYVIEDKQIEAVFTFQTGEDPTYEKIKQGKWLNDDPYGTIHRLASAGSRSGMAGICIRWCMDLCHNLRADTHADNVIMQHILEKNGFIRCGIICLQNGEPRIAYQMQEPKQTGLTKREIKI